MGERDGGMMYLIISIRPKKQKMYKIIKKANQKLPLPREHQKLRVPQGPELPH